MLNREVSERQDVIRGVEPRKDRAEPLSRIRHIPNRSVGISRYMSADTLKTRRAEQPSAHDPRPAMDAATGELAA